jgi:hypothetical protein
MSPKPIETTSGGGVYWGWAAHTRRTLSCAPTTAKRHVRVQSTTDDGLERPGREAGAPAPPGERGYRWDG